MSSYDWPQRSGSGSGVTTLNGLTGDLTIAAGTGISVTPSGGNTLTIAATGGGDVTLAAFGSTPNANGLSLSSQVLNMQPADATHPGGVSIVAQSFSGTKTFDNIIDLGLTASQAVITDGSKQLSSIAYSTNSSASSLIERDSNQNAFANNFISKATNVVSAGSTTVLTAGSSRLQQLTGSSTQIFQLPDATTLTVGSTWEFNNNSTGVLSITDGSGGAVTTVPSGGYGRIVAIAVSTTAGSWDKHFLIPSNSSWGTSALTIGGTVSATNLSGTNTGDVTIGTANGLSLSGQALSLGTSSTSTTGALTSTDWNTFNGKQASGNYITALTGDGSASGPGSSALTLATVNTNVGTFGTSTAVPSITVNGKGLITAISTNTVGQGLMAVATKTVAYTTTATDNVLKFNMSGSSNASYAVTLHTAVGNTGQILIIFYSVGTGILSINTTSAQTIGGLASGAIKMGTVNDTITLVSDGANWQIERVGINMGVRYTGTTSTVSGTDAIVKFKTLKQDPLSLYSTSTGQYTAIFPGRYMVSSACAYGGTFALNGFAGLTIYNGSTATSAGFVEAGGAMTGMNVAVVDYITLAAGDAITVKAQSSASSPTLIDAATQDWISVQYLGF